jgi:excisionase family DNA binding protein
LKRPRSPQPSVIAAAPIRDLAERLRHLAEAAHELNPSNPMVETLQGVCREMDRAFEQAAAEEAWLTVAEVAARIGVSDEAVRWQIRERNLDAERAGKQYRISLPALQAYLTGSRSRRGGAS